MTVDRYTDGDSPEVLAQRLGIRQIDPSAVGMIEYLAGIYGIDQLDRVRISVIPKVAELVVPHSCQVMHLSGGSPLVDTKTHIINQERVALIARCTTNEGDVVTGGVIVNPLSCGVKSVQVFREDMSCQPWPQLMLMSPHDLNENGVRPLRAPSGMAPDKVADDIARKAACMLVCPKEDFFRPFRHEADGTLTVGTTGHLTQIGRRAIEHPGQDRSGLFTLAAHRATLDELRELYGRE